LNLEMYLIVRWDKEIHCVLKNKHKELKTEINIFFLKPIWLAIQIPNFKNLKLE